MQIKMSEQGEYSGVLKKDGQAMERWSAFRTAINVAVRDAVGGEDCVVHSTVNKMSLRVVYGFYCSSVDQYEKVFGRLEEKLRTKGYDAKDMPKICMIALTETLLRGSEGKQSLLGIAEFHFHLRSHGQTVE